MMQILKALETLFSEPPQDKLTPDEQKHKIVGDAFMEASRRLGVIGTSYLGFTHISRVKGDNEEGSIMLIVFSPSSFELRNDKNRAQLLRMIESLLNERFQSYQFIARLQPQMSIRGCVESKLLVSWRSIEFVGSFDVHMPSSDI